MLPTSPHDRQSVSIHPLALVSPESELGTGVTVAAFATIEAGVTIGENCSVGSGSVIKTGVTIGDHNEICEHAVIGGQPQHTARPETVGRIVIGNHNVFREGVSIHRALKPDGQTTVGDHNYLMAGAHLGHDTHLGNNCVFANNSLAGGHVVIEDHAFVSGAVAIHQFCRVGQFSMIGGHARVVQDVPPFMLIDGQSGSIVGLNTIGLRRAGYPADELTELKAAYRAIYRRGLSWTEVLETLKTEFTTGLASHLHTFLAQGRRGFVQERRSPPSSTSTLRLRIADEEKRNIRAKAG
ncbi:acyl-ACP--UDP-N-acetylglucosamine O-acyltransferase [Pirellulales bacterium]|nr:acyl-ACP--UDP-N-acetylglucosamine O-acyltransferase [Pirellulales bacterium]MDA7937497.1 acyl-ACP--UDP-N-acetylglucosamine O-acyltransferase [Pirellulales bacterium]